MTSAHTKFTTGLLGIFTGRREQNAAAGQQNAVRREQKTKAAKQSARRREQVTDFIS